MRLERIQRNIWKGIAIIKAKRVVEHNTLRIGFSLKASDNVAYSEAMIVYTICLIVHYYPSYTKESVLELTQSQIWMLIEMISNIENPKNLSKYKDLKFSSKFEFEQYILNKFKMI